MIRIERTCKYSDIFKKYKIILDGYEIGSLKPGEGKRFQTSEGEHTMYVTIGRYRSNEIKFNAYKGRSIEFACGNRMEDWKIFFAFLYQTFLQNKYLWLDRV